MKMRVEFEVPDHIATGLANGTLERVGGVIRYTDSKRIVRWLREGGNVSRSSSSGLNLLPTLLTAVGMNKQTIGLVAGAVTIAGPLIDVAIVGYTIHTLNQRIDALQKEIESIYDRLDINFEKAKAAQLDAAQTLAEKFLGVAEPVAQQMMFANVLTELVAAEKTLVQDIIHSLDGNKLRLAERQIACLISVNTLAARCALDFDQSELALRSLEASQASLRPHVERLVKRLVRKNAALYFHKSVSDDYLDRYIQIRGWLHGNADIWERVAKEARNRFWNEDSVEALYQEKRIFLHTWPELRKRPFYKENIPRAERLIENFQRFESYALYLEASDRLPDDLEQLSDEAAKRLADHDDYALLVDECELRREGRLSA